jgi:hypothetical protein
MKARWWVFACVVVAALASGVVGCGGGAQPKFAQVKAGEMPADQSWPGVYYNAEYGYLHMIEKDGSIVGRWKRTKGDFWGELSGSTQGNVMHFTWTEHKYGGVGPSADTHGSGQFVYTMGEAAGEIHGQYALDGSDSVADWNCVKQNNMKPDLDSINGQTQDNTGVTPDQWK